MLPKETVKDPEAVEKHFCKFLQAQPSNQMSENLALVLIHMIGFEVTNEPIPDEIKSEENNQAVPMSLAISQRVKLEFTEYAKRFLLPS